MLLNEYQIRALATLSDKGDLMNLQHAIIGLCTETAEVLDMVKKTVFYDKDNFTYSLDKIDLPHIGEELGDQLWYIAVALWSLNGVPTRNSGVLVAIEKAPLAAMLELPEKAEFLAVQSKARADLKDAISENMKGLFISECIMHSYINSAALLSTFRSTSNPSEFKRMEVYVLLVEALNSVGKVASLFGLSLDTIAQLNIEKLRKRYERNGGSFDEHCAKFRDLNAERVVLEANG